MTQRRNIIWDPFIRIFHWCQLLLVAVCWWSAENGQMEWHFLSAYLLLAFLVGRLVWGVIGSDTARFRQFLKPPRVVWQYLRGQAQYRPGHNPAGGWMVVVLLSALAFQLCSGLFASDDMFYEGPLSGLISGDTVATLTSLHKLNFDLILVLVGVHILAVLIYEIRGKRLLLPMLNGGAGADTRTKRSWPMLVMVGIVASLLVWLTDAQLPL